MSCRAPDMRRLRSCLRYRPGQRGVLVAMHAAQFLSAPDGSPVRGIDPADAEAGAACMELLAAHPRVRTLVFGHDHLRRGPLGRDGLDCFFAGRCGGSWGLAPAVVLMELDAWGRIRSWQSHLLEHAGPA